jgi:hypothetical protein
MDISPVAVYAQKAAAVQSEFATQVLKKSLDITTQQAQDVVSLIQGTNANLGQNLDVKA